ncbi:MAG: hypothetical protein GC151_15875 [Betaproteobacteria bacterium]|nr:hypothetical protein [Betaproteobacteria bacterium]
MTRRVAATIVALLVVWGPCAGGAAELRGDKVFLCDSEHEISGPLRPGALVLAVAPDLERGAYGDAFTHLADVFDQSLSASNQARKDVRTFVSVLPGAAKEDHATFQIGPVLGKHEEALFQTTDVQITFDCDALAQYQIDMASVALVTSAILAKKELPGFRDRAQAVAAASHRYESLIRNGLPMWPWELWLNGKRLGDGDASRLFTRQIVFMRPSAGIEVNTRSRETANMDAALALEPIGFVQYRDDDYSSWWGVSAVITTTTRRGAGYGVLFRYGNYSVGLTRHKSDVPGSSDDTYLMVNVDLYDLIQKKRGELPGWTEGLRQRARDALLSPR